ncbi:putative lipoprotein [hydrocarbon metagenome]|uniref:Putative lipoprotein n=1 Tax=hydrocarbon metagenome TaxID=938273 RepID=A0A0W8FQ21_9ZZZZ
MFNYVLRKISCVTVVVLVIFYALSATAGAQEKSADNSITPIHIAIISFQPLIPEDEQRNTVICPVCGIGLFGGKILNGSEKIVEEVFVGKLNELKRAELIPSDKVQDVYKRSVSESLKEPLLNVFKKVGKELGADVLAVGYIYRYIERVGSEYGSEHPASVAFEIHLIRIADGKVIWRGFFDKTQKSLMEDVFQISSFIKGGGKWLTARQLTKQGMDKVFETFPRLEH